MFPGGFNWLLKQLFRTYSQSYGSISMEAQLLGAIAY